MKRNRTFLAITFCLAIVSLPTCVRASLVEIPVVAASAINTGGGAPINAFNGIYTDYWHTASTAYPNWVQADFGSSQTVVRIEIYNEKDHPWDILLATAFDIWVGNDPTFSPGSYTVAAQVTNNTVVNAVVDFASPATGRYLRYVVWALAQPELSYATCIYEMDIFTETGSTNHAPVAQSQSISVSKNTPQAITLSASDLESDPITYSVVSGPVHGTLSGTAPALTYTPATDYYGPDSFTFMANDGKVDSNTGTVSIGILSGSPVLPVVAAVASSMATQVRNAFDGNNSTYWQLASDNFGYTDKWVEADLGNTKTIDTVEVSFGLSDNSVATAFKVWIGNDPSFPPGQYTEVANVTGNTLREVILAVNPAVNGRWVRLVVTGVVGPSLSDYRVAEMRTYGVDASPAAESKYAVSSATASSSRTGLFPSNAFNGDYGDYWHVSSDADPKWVQADLGGRKWVSRIVAYEYGGIGISDRVIKHIDFQIWVGDDAAFSAGTYAVATTVTGNDDYIIQRGFATVAGRYVRFVITHKEGPSYDYNCLYELEVWGTGAAPLVNHPPVAQNQSISMSKNASQAITLSASDLDGDPLTYSIVSSPAHGTLSGTAPALTYTSDTDYTGSDSFRFKANDGKVDSDIADVSIEIASDTLVRIPVVSAIASSAQFPAIQAFDGNYDQVGSECYCWHVTPADNAFPKWLQADFGSRENVSQVKIFNSKTVVYDTLLATNFAIWVGDDPAFTAGTYTVAAQVTGNSVVNAVVDFASPVAGRYLRYVVYAVAHPELSYATAIYEMEVWGTGNASGVNYAPVAQSQSVSVSKNTPRQITISASDLDGDPLTYSITSSPAHGTLSGTAPAVTYTPDTDYLGADNFTFKANDGKVDSNIGTVSISIVSGSPVLPVVAAVATSANVASSTAGNWPMRAFDGDTSSFWQIASDNFGYPDKWVQADLGNTKAIDNVQVNFGPSESSVATGFKLWIGDDPSFGPGNYTEVASVTGNSFHEISQAVSPAVNGRWVRLIITGVAGSSMSDYQVAEMQISGSDGPASAESKYAVPSASASSYLELPRTAPINAFNGNYNDFWHVNASDASSPKWVQADLGSDKWVSRVVVYEYGGVGMLNKVLKQIDFQIWVGDEATFAPGTYTVAAIVTGNDDYGVQRSFTPTAGQYVRFVITRVSGGSYDYNCLYEMEIWGTGAAPLVNHAPIAASQAAYVYKNTAKAITLTASDRDSDPLTYSIVSNPTHGTLSGTAPALTYIPATDYFGSDSFTFKVNDGELDSNIGTVNLTFIESSPYVQAVSVTQLYDVAAHLVEDYGPRRVDVFSPFTNNACTYSTVVYPKSNVEMASDYLKALYESWGYQVTMEDLTSIIGAPAHNVVATKIGSVYPSIFIDVGGHLDTQPSTPGAGDNASGSTAVVEIARVLKDYPNRYSIRFINDVGHETCGNCGMAEHVRLLLGRGEQIKAGLMMDGIGWSIIPGANNNEVWWNNLSPGTQRIVGLFDSVRSLYGIDINFNGMHQPYAGGDGQPYLDQGLPAIMSIGGTPYNAPGYHGCGDTMAVMDMQNILKITQQNLAVMLLLDQENEANPPLQTLRVEKIGDGSVTSDPAGVDCGADCSEAYNYNTLVTLTAVPAAGFSFIGWSGAASSGTGPCMVTMDQARTITATFTQNVSPVVARQPVNQAVTAGHTASFSAAAAGVPAPTVQWQVSGDGGGTWADVSGATATALSFVAQFSDHGKQYRAVFTNPVGTATSDAASLLVNRPPIANAASKTCTLGLSVKFKIKGSGGLASDPDSDALAVSATVPAHGTATVVGDYIVYQNDGTGPSDGFDYTVDDQRGGTVSGALTITVAEPSGLSLNTLSPPVDIGGGQRRIEFLGRPGSRYALEHATSLDGPWAQVVGTSTQAVDSTGLVRFDFTPPGGTGYFRTRWVP